VIADCTFSGNSATSSSSGIGGAIINFATLTVANSTFADNSATAFGGAIANDGPGPLTVTSSTLSGNVAGFGGGGVDLSGAPGPTFRNTILAGNAAPSSPNVRGTLASQGHNLIGDGSGGSGYADTDVVGTAARPIDPLVGPLQENGGPTITLALLPGSPALNAGDPEELGSPDQRGVVRAGGVNIGAYQASATAFLVTAPRRVQSGVPFDVTVTAVDPFGQVAVGYTGTVTFSTTDPDPAVVLPADYTFTLDDGGMHTFSNTGLGETTLLTLRRQTITVADTADSAITGQVTVRVRRSPSAPDPAPGHGAGPAASVPADGVWLLAPSMRHSFSQSDPMGWALLDGADLLGV
jgi:hypothetical protein